MAVQSACKVAGFEWDEGNRDECEKHGVSLAEVESAFYAPVAVFPDPEHSSREERFKAIGRTDAGRSVLIVFTLRMRRGETFIRPISRRYMNSKEIEHYEKEAAEAQKRQSG